MRGEGLKTQFHPLQSRKGRKTARSEKVLLGTGRYFLTTRRVYVGHGKPTNLIVHERKVTNKGENC